MQQLISLVRNEGLEFKVFFKHKIKYFSDGTTFHTGLRFSYGNEYSGIKEEQLNQLRKQFEDMMVVIIDEMSLVMLFRPL